MSKFFLILTIEVLYFLWSVDSSLDYQPKMVVEEQENICGMVNSDITFETLEEFPWIVAINYRNRNKNSKGISRRVDTFRCLGSLITGMHVLTSASCVDVDWWLLEIDSIRVGKYNIEDSGIECVKNLYSNECTASTLDIQVDKIMVYPTYDSFSLVDNLAIIKLAGNVTYTDYVRPICWREPPTEINNDTKYNRTYWTAGYSMDDKTKIRKRSDREEIASRECETRLAHYVQVDAYNISARTFCTKDTMSAPCIMDAGSPLFYRSDADGRWHQRGVSSFNTNCTDHAITSYVDIQDYLPWLWETVRKLV